MKRIVLLVPVVVLMCILSSGCVTKTTTDNDNGNISFTTFTLPTPGVRGQLTISNDGWTGEYPVSVDRKSVGVVSTKSPITLMLEEGMHTVEVCCGRICEQQNVTISFGRQRTVDFSEQFKKDLKFSEPTVQIIGYYLNGERITVDVEFINPTTQALGMAADISCGYSYIERRSNQRLGDSARGHLFVTVNPCDRITQTLNLDLASGSHYNYDMPTINQVSFK